MPNKQYLPEYWFGLVVGNSRFHWAVFEDDLLLKHWHTPYLLKSQLLQLIQQKFNQHAWQQIDPHLQLPPLKNLGKSGEHGPDSGPNIWMASVVDAQTKFLQEIFLPQTIGVQMRTVERDRLPLKGLYSTLGLDRVLNLWGASLRYGWPTLVIDAGTALTLTAGNDDCVLGGMILPGLTLQSRALSETITALPEIDFPTVESFPIRWALSTVESIQSGILYTTLAGIESHLTDWWHQHPHSTVIFTGGDGELLYRLNKSRTPVNNLEVRLDSNLMFWGLRAYRKLAKRGNTGVIA